MQISFRQASLEFFFMQDVNVAWIYKVEIYRKIFFKINVVSCLVTKNELFKFLPWWIYLVVPMAREDALKQVLIFRSLLLRGGLH